MNSAVPAEDSAKVRVTRDNTCTTFAVRYKVGQREITGHIRITRMYHPIRGEEVQIELETGKTIPCAARPRQTLRHDRMIAAMHMPPDQVDELIATLQGKPRSAQ